MATLLPYRYPLDLTGTSPDNLVIDEPHQMVRRKVRCIAPMYAPFFKDSLKIYDGLSTTPLTTGQFKLANIIPLPTAMAGMGKEVYAIVVITDESVSDNITLDYQTVGGDFVQSFEAALTLLEALSQDNRPASWPNIIDRPALYPPDLHLQAIGDTIGWEYAAVAIQQIREAILNGDARSNDQILAYIDMQTAALQGLIAAQAQVGHPLGDHIANTNNPHNVTKAQVGLALVQNFPVATVAEAQAGTALNRYMTPSLVAAAIANINSVSIGNHPLDFNNPHKTNKEQVGLGLVDDFATATIAQGVTGSASNLFMTPAATKAAINAAVTSIGGIGDAHIARIDNPHQVTKDQVDLGNVQNYGVATVPQTVTGTATNLYVTPAGVKGAVDAVKGAQQTALATHIADTNNPHAVDKGDVDLGNVANYPPATDAEGVAGTATDRYMTPKATKAALASVNLDVSSKADAILVGSPNGIAPLNVGGLIDTQYLVNAPGSNIRDVHHYAAGRPTINSVLVRQVVARPLQWLANFTDSLAYVNIAPNAAVVINVRRNTDALGTITFASGSKTGVWAGAAGNAVAGDVLEFFYNGTGDTTLTDLVLSFAAKAYAP